MAGAQRPPSPAPGLCSWRSWAPPAGPPAPWRGAPRPARRPSSGPPSAPRPELHLVGRSSPTWEREERARLKNSPNLKHEPASICLERECDWRTFNGGGMWLRWERLLVWSLAPPSGLSKCPWARHNANCSGCVVVSALGVWMCTWMGEHEAIF